jgi:hypothetical protein
MIFPVFLPEERSVGVACRPWHACHVRWNDEKSLRFQALRATEARGALTDAEREELSRLLADLDADEADQLRPAMERAAAHAGDLAAEKEQLEAQADALARIATEQQRLLSDATAYLQKLRDKSAAGERDAPKAAGAADGSHSSTDGSLSGYASRRSW